MDKGDQTGIAGIGIGIFLTVGTLVWPWPIPDEIRHILFWISAFFVLAGCLWLLDLHFLNKKRKVVRGGIPISLIILLGVLIAKVEWPKNSSVAGNPLDDQISLSCETSERPTNYRNHGDLHTYELGAPPTYWGMPFPAAGADTWLSSGEGPINWAGMRTASFSKCTISNYSNSAILNAVVVIPAWYSLPIKTKNGFTTGSFITGRFVISPFLNLDPVTSPNNTDYFYIENDTKYFVQFPAPTTIQISLAGSNERQTVKLIPPSMPIMGLWPVNPSTNPPN